MAQQQKTVAVTIVEELSASSQRSVDPVADPATTRSLFELEIPSTEHGPA